MERLPSTRALWAGHPDAGPSSSERTRVLTRLREALRSALTERQREAVCLYFFEGLSEAAIAKRLGISQQVVHRRIHGARRGGRRIGGALSRLREALLDPNER